MCDTCTHLDTRARYFFRSKESFMWLTFVTPFAADELSRGAQLEGRTSNTLSRRRMIWTVHAYGVL